MTPAQKQRIFDVLCPRLKCGNKQIDDDIEDIVWQDIALLEPLVDEMITEALTVAVKRDDDD